MKDQTGPIGLFQQVKMQQMRVKKEEKGVQMITFILAETGQGYHPIVKITYYTAMPPHVELVGSSALKVSFLGNIGMSMQI